MCYSLKLSKLVGYVGRFRVSKTKHFCQLIIEHIFEDWKTMWIVGCSK